MRMQSQSGARLRWFETQPPRQRRRFGGAGAALRGYCNRVPGLVRRERLRGRELLLEHRQPGLGGVARLGSRARHARAQRGRLSGARGDEKARARVARKRGKTIALRRA